MKALALKLKELAMKLLDIMLMSAYPPSNHTTDQWWNYIDY
jgi:hypothetical protein